MAMQLNEKNFSEEVLKSDVPVLVDFWAEWCMPCKMLAPVIEELSSEANGTYKVEHPYRSRFPKRTDYK